VESFAAELAWVGSGVGVDEQVRGQRRRSFEALAALAALEAALGTVHCSVLTQADRVAERLTTCVAFVRATTSAVCPTSVNLRDTRTGRTCTI